MYKYIYNKKILIIYPTMSTHYIKRRIVELLTIYLNQTLCQAKINVNGIKFFATANRWCEW